MEGDFLSGWLDHKVVKKLLIVSSQVLTAILFNPYEDKPTFSLSLVLGSRGGFGFIPGVSASYLLFSFPAFPFFFYSDLHKSSLNGLTDLKERKYRSFFCLHFSHFFRTLGVFFPVSLTPICYIFILFLTKPILVFS